MARKKVAMKSRVLAFLQKSRKKNLTYAEVAKHLKTAPMAVGQCLKVLGKEGHKRLTNRVKSKKEVESAA